MEILQKIFKDKFARAAFIVLAIMYILILFADFIAPYSNYYSNRDMSYAPPSKIYTSTEDGKLSLPYTYNYVREYEPSLTPKRCLSVGIIPSNLYFSPFTKGFM